MSPPFVTPFVCNSFCIPLRLCATGGGDRFCRLSAPAFGVGRHHAFIIYWKAICYNKPMSSECK